MVEPDSILDINGIDGSGQNYVISLARIWQDEEKNDHPAPWFFKERDMWTNKIPQYLAASQNKDTF